MTDFVGTAGNDDFTGTADADSFDMTLGGVDIVRGAGGDDAFNFGAVMTADDRVFGGGGNDGLVLGGDYGAGIVFNHDNFRSVEQILLFGDNTYALGFEDNAVARGDVLHIDVAFGAGQLILFSQESNAVFDVHAGDGDDTIITGGGNDIIDSGEGQDSIFAGLGNDTINGGDGDDRIYFSTGELTGKDRIDDDDPGDYNTVVLNGDYSAGVTLAANTFHNINVLEVDDGDDYVVDMGRTTVTATFIVNASQLDGDSTIDFDGSHMQGAGHFAMTGGSGDDRFTGGAGSDSLVGGLGADRLEGRGALDFYSYHTAAESTGTDYDTVVGFDTSDDLFDLSLIGIAVQAVDAKVNHGKLSTAHFDTHLANAIGTGELGASHAVLFTPDAGTLAGQIFLVIDCNNAAGYQAGADLVIRMLDPHHLAALSAGDFFTV